MKDISDHTENIEQKSYQLLACLLAKVGSGNGRS